MVKYLTHYFVLGRNSSVPGEKEPDIDMRIKVKDYVRPFAKLDRGRDRAVVVRTRGDCDAYLMDIQDSPISRSLT